MGSTLTAVGGDVHNHYYHPESQRDIWAALRSIPNFRKIYLDILSRATPKTGMWLLKGSEFRLWLEPNGDITIFWGSGIRRLTTLGVKPSLTCGRSWRWQKFSCVGGLLHSAHVIAYV